MQEVECAADVGSKQASYEAKAWKVLLGDTSKEAGKVPKSKYPSS